MRPVGARLDHRQRRNLLEQEKLQGKPGQVAGRLTHADLVILDELGYLPFSASGRVKPEEGAETVRLNALAALTISATPW